MLKHGLISIIYLLHTAVHALVMHTDISPCLENKILISSQISVGGIIMLKNTDTDTPEELIEPLKGEQCSSNVIQGTQHTCVEYIRSSF